MPTPHNAAHIEDIAETILLPGDPIRARLIAETFLSGAKCFNEIRGMLGYTGEYKGHRISVMGTGMGMPSIGIVSHELISEYGCRNLIRVGSCGAFRRNIRAGDLVIAQGACTDSNFAHQYGLPGTYSAIADYDLLSAAVSSAKSHNMRAHVGNILSSDVFYNATGDEWRKWQAMGVLGAEMESYALYCEAAVADVSSLGIFTVSDNLTVNYHASAERREKSFESMVTVALDAAISKLEATSSAICSRN